MITAAMLVAMTRDPEKNSEARTTIIHIHDRRKDVVVKVDKLEEDGLPVIVLVELAGAEEMRVRDSLAEIRIGLGINGCRVWHEQVSRVVQY